jgi:hypothetical protein
MRAPSCVIKDIITHLTRSKPPAAIPLSCRFFEQLWCCRNTLTILKESPTAERIAWFATQSIQHRGLAMSIAGLTSTEQTTAIRAVSPANDVRALITNHLGIASVVLPMKGGSWATRCVVSLVCAVRPDSRLIFSFMSTTPHWPASGPMCCAFNAHTAEPNMRRRWTGLPQSHSRSKAANETHRVSAPRGSLITMAANALARPLERLH